MTSVPVDPTSYDPSKLVDVDAFLTQIQNGLGLMKGQNPSSASSGSDPIADMGNNPAPFSTTSGGTATPMGGSLSDNTYDGFGISQEFGVGGHPGMDIATPVGTQLIAPISGTVTHAGNDDPGGYGAWVEITGSDGTVVRYGHMSSIGVATGAQVSPGTLLGLSGGAKGASGSGNATGPHLHFEVHPAAGSAAVDPSSYLAGGWQILGGGS